jgi:CHASE3 domain sensor protein
MSIVQNAQEELDKRIDKLENLIADRGLGSKQLKKAQTAQRNLNLAIFTGGLVAIAGALWAVNRFRS